MIETNFKHTDIGPIPHDWEVKRLEEISEPIYYGIAARAVKYDGATKYIRITDIDDQTHRFSPAPLSSPDFYTEDYTLKEGDLLFTRTGSSVGKSYLYTTKDGRMVFAGFLMKAHIYGANPTYVFYQTLTNRYCSWVDSQAKRTGQPGINAKQLSNLELPIPPIEEQEAIGKALSDIDELIGGLRKLIEKKRNIKQGAMSRLLSGSLRLPGFNKPWETNLLGDLGIFIKGKGISRDESNSGSIPAIRYGEIYTDYSDYIKKFRSHISQKVAETSQSLKYGDICFAASGETLDDIGKAVAFVDDFEAYAGGDIVIFRPQKEINPIFFGFLLNTPSVVLQKSLKGHGLSIMHIRAASLAELVINYPTDIAEQEAIAKVLTDMDAEIEKLEKKLLKYEQVKQGMMKQLLTGKIRLI